MPDVLTHIICGEEAVQLLDNSSWKNILLEYKKIFNLGCQGPDIFLYNDFWPWIKEKRGPKIGILIHTKKTGDFFIEGIKYIKENRLKGDNFKVLFSYLCGFICHFGLDRNAHPYIHYYSGYHDKKRPETRKYSGYHKRLELIIDSIIYKEKKNIDAYKYPIYKEIDIQSDFPKVIANFYKYILNKLFKYDIEIDFIEDSYKDMKKVLRLVYDRYGCKKVILNFIEIITNRKFDYGELVYPRRIDKKHDYMNRNHNIWNHPCDKKEVYSDSFDDIYNRAVRESKEMIEAMIKYMEDKIDNKGLDELFPNISYSTGKPANKKCDLIYYDPIFD
jgi:hypothetical protein